MVIEGTPPIANAVGEFYFGKYGLLIFFIKGDKMLLQKNNETSLKSSFEEW